MITTFFIAIMVLAAIGFDSGHGHRRTLVTMVIAMLIFATGLVLAIWIPPENKSVYSNATDMWGGFGLLWITAVVALQSQDSLQNFLKANAKSIGCKNIVVARTFLIIGLLAAIWTVVASILRLLHKP